MHSFFAFIKKFIFLGLLFSKFLPNITETQLDTLSTWPSIVYNKPTATSKTLTDMSVAFKVVVNDSNQISHLIPKMFNLSITDPAYVFRLPNDLNSEPNYLEIHKNDMAQPAYPNLTANYVRFMSAKTIVNKNKQKREKHGKLTKAGIDLWNLIRSNSLDLNDDKALLMNLQTERNFIEYVNELNRKENNLKDEEEDTHDEWALLGLFGWKGEISKPKRSYGSIFNIGPESTKPKLSWDLPGKVQEAPLDQNTLEVMKNSSFLKDIKDYSPKMFYTANMRGEHSDADVYIGRVNDPFGHSTKWNLRNSSNYTPEDDRKKRGVIGLYSMIKCSTGCDPIVYKGYGCYCGFLGNGQAVDGIDQCCKLHDKCYDNSNCISYLEYFVPYIWKCYRGKPLCAIDHGEWGGPDSCAARLCQCDLTLSRCLRRFVCPRKRAICWTSRTRMLQNLLFNF